MNQVPQRPFVKPKAGGTVKTPQAGPADRTNAVLIQREVVYKRSVAAGAKVLSLKRNRGRKAFRTDRNPSPSG